MIAPDDLRAVAVFADLADDELAWLAEIAEERSYAPGQALASEGDAADSMFAVLSGQVQFRMERVADTRVFLTSAGELTGLVPFSRMTSYPGTVRATVPTRVAVIAAERFGEMMRRVPVLEQRFVSLLADRVREATRAEQQREKLMALGKLSAGLAHEMNNPASAMRRGAAHLRDRLRALPRLSVNLAGCNLDVAQFSAVAALLERATGREEEPERLSPLEASQREEEVGEWLEARGVEEPWLLAETFVASRLGVDDLDGVARVLPERSLPDAFAWLGSGLAADRLLREMEGASRRISELVASVKSYSRMDETSARAEIDVHEGLESTLTMLSFKLRKYDIRIERDYDPALPHPLANAGEINQVWTNLIDNAIDAVAAAGGGRIWLRTMRREDDVVVEVHDDGPGIAPEIQERIWEPFFTTKDVGAGTGLGLDIARRIVVRQHGGQISLQSRPGDTCFQVRLPVRGFTPPPATVAADDSVDAAATMAASGD